MKTIICSIIFFINFFVSAQTIIPDITARVDTSKTAVKEVYHVYKNYLNSKPDSIYKNPFWNEKEAEIFLKTKLLKIERSADLIYHYYRSSDYLSIYKPKVIQIDSIASNRYQIKTIFAHNYPEPEYKNSTPAYITKLYAVRNNKGVFKLENVLTHDIKNWKVYNFKFIKYIVHPNCNFDRKEAKKAVEFCNKIAKQFNLKIEPFTYYVLPNSDEMGKLYNFEYWTSYLGGQTNILTREIFTTYSNENYPHEIVHMLFPLPKDNSSFCPMIINEGLATWLAGPGFDETFESSLKETSQKFQNQKSITLDDIITFKFRNDYDNSILYITGGVICQFVYEKHGEKGIWKLYNSTNSNFKEVLESLFNEPYEMVEKRVINYITNFNK